ncbi:hypothetical protein FQZ97_766550 [compost metagenome]
MVSNTRSMVSLATVALTYWRLPAPWPAGPSVFDTVYCSEAGLKCTFTTVSGAGLSVLNSATAMVRSVMLRPWENRG